MSALCGIELQDWQRDIVADMSAYDERGKFVHQRVGLSIPRQAGKSFVAIAWVVYLVVAKHATVLWTDHNYSTTCEMLRRFREVFGKKPNDPTARYRQFNRKLMAVNNKTAQEAMFFKGGGSLHFCTRTKSAALGYSFDVIVYDEAQELTDEHLQALAPTTAAGALHNTQSVYTGTPCRAGSSAYKFADFRAEFADGAQPDDACWWEWGVPEVGDVRDFKRLYEVNPSLGRTADMSAIKSGVVQLTDMAAAQEYYGYWLPSLDTMRRAVPRELWDACKVAAPVTRGLRSFGVKFTPDGMRAAVCVAVRPDDGGAPFVDAVFERDVSHGMRWLVDWLRDRADACAWIAMDGKAGAQPLFERLKEEGAPACALHLMGTRDMVAACAGLLDSVRSGELRHCGQQALAASCTLSAVRNIGHDGGWGFASTEEAEPHLAEACAIALWASRNSDNDPTDEGMIG